MRSKVVRWLSGSGSAADADDVVQEVFLRARTALGRFRGDSLPSTWLLGIARHVIADRRAADARLRRLAARSAEDADIPNLHHATPADICEWLETYTAVADAIAEMPRNWGSAIEALALGGLSGTEPEGSTGRSAATLRVHLFRGRRALRRRLAETVA